MATSGRRSGGRRDIPDPRDFIKKYAANEIPPTATHPTIDLRKYINHVYDQGTLESCTANALCAAYGLDLRRQAEKIDAAYYYFDPSRLFVYYNSREYEGATADNVGVSLRDAIKAIALYGVCRESFWPYDTTQFKAKPSHSCYNAAVGNTVSKYERLEQDIHQFRACLKEGFPFVFGFEYFRSFESPANELTGLMPLPSVEEVQFTQPTLHVALAVGYDDKTERITALNSWGESFGDKGYFYMPYKYISNPNRTFDFWKIERVSESGVTI